MLIEESRVRFAITPSCMQHMGRDRVASFEQRSSSTRFFPSLPDRPDMPCPALKRMVYKIFIY